LTKTKLPGNSALYEWAAGKPPGERLALVSVLPEGEPIGGELGAGGQDARHAISDDGSRVFWTGQATNAQHEQVEHLYMRDLTYGQTAVDGEVIAGETVQLDAVQPGVVEPEIPAPVFQDASADGSRVFFTDKQRLTEGSGGGLHPDDLYECETVQGAGGKLECSLHDLTPETATEESADVLGVLGLSEEGCDVGSPSPSECDVYFVANGKLTADAVAGNCNRGGVELCNLYVDRDGTISLVAVLSGDDSADWAGGEPTLEDLAARVSPGGGWVAFMSDRELTGDDPDDAVSGHPDEEVYLYNAVSGRLVCASCDPSGARPVGVKSDVTPIFEGTGEAGAFPSDWLSGLLPSWDPYEHLSARYQYRYLSDSGRLFFDSVDALVPRDINGTWDVYEYEPEGVPGNEHACTGASGSGSVVFKSARVYEVEGRVGEEGAGCVGLISSGASPEESAFMDASESGGDVFFMTTSRLAPQDIESTYAVYDAHECTSQSPCIPQSASVSGECVTAEACRAAPVPEPSIYGAPSSATFSGQGNVPASSPVVKATKAKVLTRAQKLAAALKACRKKVRHVKQCEKAARAKYGLRGKKAARKGRSGRS
jgi:hypothetical protein